MAAISGSTKQLTFQHQEKQPPHRPLNIEHREIRILQVLPAKSDADPIVCRLLHTSLDSPMPYQALSYTWADPLFRQDLGRTIDIDGHNFHVGNNAYDFLQGTRPRKAARINLIRRLLSPKQPSYIWIDAICIDQKDLKERAYQVQMMRDIYGKATRVVVWLGEAKDHSNLAFDLLSELITARLEDEALVSHFLDLANRPAWEALRFLFLRHYWKRIWILQELRLASTILFACGNRTIPGRPFLEISETIETSLSTAHKRKLLSGQTDMIAAFAFGGPQNAMLDLGSNEPDSKPVLCLVYALIAYPYHRATDPRDKIYALLSLVSQNQIDGLPIDYTISVEELFINFSKLVALQDSSIDFLVPMLSQSSLGTSRPSWVPDWGDYSWNLTEGRPWIEYNASCGMEVDLRFECQNPSDSRCETLLARGIVLERLHHLTEPMPDSSREPADPFDRAEIIRIVEEWRMLLPRFNGSLDAGEAAFWRCMTLAPFDLNAKVPASSFHRFFEILRRRDYLKEDREWISTVPWRLHDLIDADTIVTQHVDDMRFIVGWKRLFVNTNLIGTVHHEAQIGDCICIIGGSSFPVVLRPRHEGGYTLIGNAYVDGYMMGKAIKDTNEGKFTIQEFEIY